MRNWHVLAFFLSICLLQFLIVTLAAEGAIAERMGRDGDFLGAGLRARVQQQLPSGVRVEIGDINTLAKVPSGADLELLSPNPPLGVISFSAHWVVNGAFHSTHGTALVQAYAPVAVTRQPLRPGDPLSPENISFQERELSPYAQSGYFIGWDSLRHVRTRGFARAGMVLGSANTELPLPVHQGEMVELSATRGPLRIVAQVRALENGKVDQMIRVQNPTTNRIMLARVSGAGTLELH